MDRWTVDFHRGIRYLSGHDPASAILYLSRAVQNCPLAYLVYLAALLVFAWNTIGLLLGLKITRGRLLRLRPGQGRGIIGFGSALVIMNWVYRLALGLQ